MRTAEETERENRLLRKRLSRLSEASVRINESLEFETVLKGVLDSARALTDSRYGVIVFFDEAGDVQDVLFSGMTPEQERQMVNLPDGKTLCDNLVKIRQPRRLVDLHSHTRSQGLPDYNLPFPDSTVFSALLSPVTYRGELVASILLGKKSGERTFYREDEEILVMFAAQAALVIANARRYSEEQRARSSLETLIDTSPVGVVVFDITSGTLVSFNREVQRFANDLGTTDQSVQDLLEVMTIKRSDGREVFLKKLVESGSSDTWQKVRAEEVVFEVPDGRMKRALVNATPICSDDTELEFYVVTLQDMTPLEDVERLRGEFLAMVSHELRTPLAAIKGSTTTVLGDKHRRGPAEMIQFFNIINQQADHMSSLIDDLLDVARIATGNLQINPEPLSVTDLIDDARKTVQTGRRRDNIRIELSPDLPSVMADRRHIIQVLGNLLSNAIKHSPEDSPIGVTAVQDRAHVTVCVSDQGRGVSAERLPHLFRKFGQLETGDRDGDESGSGWGLSICRGIVEAHGGRIWAESDGVGMGTRVTFSCPIAEPSLYATPIGHTTTTVARPVALNDRTPILVVDDDPQTLRIVREALWKAGFLPVVTGDPHEVPRLLDEHRPRLVVMDLVLPTTDGVKVMNGIIEKETVPVIFLSAYGHEDAITRALDAGAFDYIVKPFSPSELMARIRVALRERDALVKPVPTQPFVKGELIIDYTARRVAVAGRLVRLTDIEYRLLVELSVNAGRIMTYDQLLQRVWEKWDVEDTRQLRTAVKNIRRKLGDDAANPTYVFTERSIGYQMEKA